MLKNYRNFEGKLDFLILLKIGGSEAGLVFSFVDGMERPACPGLHWCVSLNHIAW